tara:strand:- start:4605 stop:5828 length:1224 start_codon:yes stop_codon:yes gene_type:complete
MNKTNAPTVSTLPVNEFERTLELSNLDLDYTELDKEFQDLSRLAAKVAGTEMSLVNLIDSFTQWTISHHGLAVMQIPREESVCNYTILNDEPMEVKDLRSDSRFCDKGYVTHGPNLRYYYGIPLKSEDGNNLGSLCVVDTHEKSLTPEKVELLKIIASEIVSRIHSMKVIEDLKHQVDEMSETSKKVSHDIRGPLSGIIGLSQIIKDQINENKVDDILELLDLIKQGGESILDLADTILSANEYSSEPLSSNEFNLVTLKEKLVKLYTPQAVMKGVNLEILNDNKNEKIPFPKNKITQIVGNIISNAIKFTSSGGDVKTKISLSINDINKELTFLIQDTGIGMTQQQISEIMKGDCDTTSGTAGESGYGFGLKLVHHLVESLKGRMDIASTEGKGTVFKICIPISNK